MVAVFTARRQRSGQNFKIPPTTPAPQSPGDSVECPINATSFCDDLLGESGETSDCGAKFLASWLNNQCQVGCEQSKVVDMLHLAGRLDATPNEAKGDPAKKSQACAEGLKFNDFAEHPKRSSSDSGAQGITNFYRSIATCIA